MRKYLQENSFENIDFIYNNSYLYKNKIICGTRGWKSGDTKEDRKIIKRENLRLELSLKDGIEKYGEDKEIISCMHYPPFNNYEELGMNYIETMRKYNVTKCVYGHIHGEPFNGKEEGIIKGIEFNLVSSDYLGFELIKLSE